MSVLVIPEFESEDELLLEPDEAAVPPVSDERANIPVSETAERFLRAVLAKVPLDRIEELHLFSPLRQGTAETGIAVIAARVIVPDEPRPSNFELQLHTGPEPEVAAPEVDEPEIDTPAVEEPDVDESVVDEPDSDEPAVEEPGADDDETQTPVVEEPEGDEAAPDEGVLAMTHGTDTADSVARPSMDPDDDSPYADEPLPVAASDVLKVAEELAAPLVEEAMVEPTVPRVRHTVYTARYRLVVKGLDRGKWEMDVVDEADAPLLAVETVVRGVQRRAGEETATVRYDAAQLARALRITT